MVPESEFISILAALLTGLMLSVGIEQFMIPRPPLRRHWAAWALHGGLWLLAYALIVLLLGRPWFSAAVVSAFLLMLVLVNNAKVNALYEPFVFQDYEYFTDAIRHPRLYIPFLGWGKFLGSATGFVLAVAIGFWGESTPAQRWMLSGQLGAIVVIFFLGLLLLLAGRQKKLPVSFNPERDVCALGLLASLWRYAEEERAPLAAVSPFGFHVHRKSDNDLPHLVAVQSESFFDPRSLYPGIFSGMLAEFDRLKGDAVAYGKLKVPAWGANTVRTEFAFLSGIGDDKLGVHRFNPYRAIAAASDVSSLAAYLKCLGYRTICIHPYPASFYRRNRVYPRLDFDEFMDIRTFDRMQRYGPYISDAAVTAKIMDVLTKAREPVFIFAITMENHGPLHLERVAPSDINELYSVPPPPGCDDLTIYLRHIRTADRMVADLRRGLEQCERPASLCWYGDHVPIMPVVYKIFGKPGRDVEYVCWSNQHKMQSRHHNLDANDLAVHWLRAIDLIKSDHH